jgi:hypothetical protein
MNDFLNIVNNKKVAFLENGDCLDENAQKLSEYMSINNVPFSCIFDVESRGLRSVLSECRDKEVLIYETTWVYPVSRELRDAFMSIQNKEFKKVFIELYNFKPSFSRKPEKIIHDLYIIDVFEREPGDFELIKLDENILFNEIKPSLF